MDNWAVDIENTWKRINHVVHHTPVLRSKTIDDITGCKVFFKPENLQRMGAFKFRGAYNAISLLDPSVEGVVTHSSGNHAQAVALAGKLLGMKTTIVMPENAPKVKIAATRGYGAEVVFCKPTQLAREKECRRIMIERGYALVHPYDDENVIMGAGTACYELLADVNLDMVIAPVGGGGLLSGTSAYAKESGKCEMVIGAEPKGADDAYRSLRDKKRYTMDNPNTIADGLRTSLSELTFSIIAKYTDSIITVDDAAIVDSMRLLFERMKIVVEPSGAVPLAALQSGVRNGAIEKGSRVGIIISGGNVDMDLYFRSLLK